MVFVVVVEILLRSLASGYRGSALDTGEWQRKE
jgi:hypothetical protein